MSREPSKPLSHADLLVIERALSLAALTTPAREFAEECRAVRRKVLALAPGVRPFTPPRIRGRIRSLFP